MCIKVFALNASGSRFITNVFTILQNMRPKGIGPHIPAHCRMILDLAALQAHHDSHKFTELSPYLVYARQTTGFSAMRTRFPYRGTLCKYLHKGDWVEESLEELPTLEKVQTPVKWHTNALRRSIYMFGVFLRGICRLRNLPKLLL